MTATEPLCRADLLRRLAALYPTLTDEELRLLADMPDAGAGDDPDD